MNKKKLSTIVVVFLGFSFILFSLKNLSQDLSLQGWHAQADGYEQAYQQQTGKPILVFFYTDWCGSCEVLKAEILSSPEVEAFMKNNMLAVKINPEKGVDAARLAKEFWCDWLPNGIFSA